MPSILSDSAYGQLVRCFTNGKVFTQLEVSPGFEASWKCTPDQNHGEKVIDADTVATSATTRSSTEIAGTPRSDQVPSELDIEKHPDHDPQQSRIIQPRKTPDGIVLTDWYRTDDAANPQNWNTRKKLITTVMITPYTFGVYSSSAIITPAHQQIQERFGVSYAVASLDLVMYVLGYGIGPLLFSPLQELPALGRTGIYVVTYILFVILAIPTALVENFAGLLVLRFITGFLGSPCLATAAASFADMYSMATVPFAIIAWTGSAFAAPSFGPVISGYAVMAKGWRWALWPILWLNGPICLAMIFFLPETLGSNILYRRARRLRKSTSNANIRTQAELDQQNMTWRMMAQEQLIKPFEITFKDPAVFFINLYTAYIYGLYYSFFEAFPTAYVGNYHFSVGATSLTFMSVVAGCLVAIVCFVCFLKFVALPAAAKKGPGENEDILIPALLMSTFLPAGMFWWGWTSLNADTHWIVGLIAIALFTFGAYVLMQCIFGYLPMSYPAHAASLFAANDFFRSSMAGVSIIFAHPLYENLGVGKGVSVVAGLAVGGVFGIWALWWFGKSLRARSDFAVK